MNIVGQALERRARRREMLLKAAIDHAWRYRDHLMEVARATQRPVDIPDPVLYAEMYYQWLDHLYRHGKLPDDPGVAESKRNLGMTAN